MQHDAKNAAAARRFLRVLKPGGRLLISDYCRAPAAPSDAFAAYIAQRGYDLHSVPGYRQLLSGAGFVDVQAEDRTWQVCALTCVPCFPAFIVAQE